MDLVLKGGGEDLEKDTSYEEDFFYRRGGPNHGYNFAIVMTK